MHGGKSTEKNIEAFFTVLDDSGRIFTDAFEIITPNKIIRKTNYTSCVIMHEDRPRFYETIKIVLPLKMIKNLHLRIVYYNRKGEKKIDKGPFALSFLRLIHNYVLKNNEIDDLIVYKIEAGKFDERNISYLQNSSTRQELRFNNSQKSLFINTSSNKTENNLIYQQNDKNTVHFKSFISSAIHTNNQRLLYIFCWRDNEELLKERLKDFIMCEDNAEELLKFLPNFLDSIFQIAENIPQYQSIVFDAIVYVIRLCDEPKYLEFKKILEDYLKNFYSPTAYIFLLQNLLWYIENEGLSTNQRIPDSRDRLLPVLKSLGILIRFIIVSKMCRDAIGFNETSFTVVDLVAKIDKLLESLALLMQGDLNQRVTCQNAALKYLPLIITPLIHYDIYSRLRLAKFIISVMEKISKRILVCYKLNFLSDIIETDLFACKECRKLLLPIFLKELLTFMPPNLKNIPKFSVDNSVDGSLEGVQTSAKILTDILEKLFPYSLSRSVIQRGTPDELSLILFECIRPLNQTVILLLNDSTHHRALHALLLALLDKFSAFNYLCYFKRMKTNIDILDMLSKKLKYFFKKFYFKLLLVSSKKDKKRWVFLT